MTMPQDDIKIGEMAERLVEPGFPKESVAAQLRGFASKHLIFSHDQIGTGRTAHRLFTRAEMAKAKVLSILVDFGFADLSVLQHAGVYLTTHVFEGKDRDAKLRAAQKRGLSPSPIEQAIQDYLSGDPRWSHFALMLTRDDQNGRKVVRGKVFRDGELPFDLRPSDGEIPRGTVLIPLTPLFVRMFADRTAGN